MVNTNGRRGGLIERITCPRCWEHFPPEKILWISEHQDLLGDQRLGPEQPQRFLPSRFNVAGEALDAKGFPCHHLACPNCHLGVPRPFLEMEPVFLSMFGAPASGKSYLLAAMTWELRKTLPFTFKVSFSDADPVLNRVLNEYQESLFANSQSEKLVPLAKLIRKTEEQGELYDMVSYGSQAVSYPRPFVFGMQPQQGHPQVANSAALSRIVCLYDNAGESFQPGKDTVSNPVTRHMAQSRTLFFVFDPTQDARFRKQCDERLGPASAVRMSSQEPILQEAASRIRRHSGLKHTQKHNRPLIVILTKCDAWLHLLKQSDGELQLTGEAFSGAPRKQLTGGQGQMADGKIDVPVSALDTIAIDQRSLRVRELLIQFCPEIVTAAEAFAMQVTYIPVSAVGLKTRLDDANGLLSIRPEDTSPYWVTVPFLYSVCRSVPGLIPSIFRKQPAVGATLK